MYITVFITGAAVLIIEILGTRVLAPFYGSTIFVWSSLISVTLGFLALGYWLGGLLADKKPDFKVFYGIIFLAGIFTSLIMKVDQPVLVFTDQFGLRLGPLVASSILFAVSFFLLGIVTPFAIRLRTQILEKIGTRSGSIFAFSTIGSLVGAIFAGFFLVPSFSLDQIFSTTGFILVLLAVVSTFFWKPQQLSFKLGTIILFLAAVIMVSVSFFILGKVTFQDSTKTMKIVHQEASFYGDIKIIEVRRFRCLAVDGALQSCLNITTQKPIFTYIDETGRLAESRDISSLLILGLGAGNVLERIPENVVIDMVEIDPRVVALSKEVLNFRLGENQQLIIDDARHFLRVTNKRYDLILVDLFLGNTLPIHVFTEEAFELMKSRLNPQGLVLVNLEGGIGKEDKQIATIMKTAGAVFPSVKLTTTEPEMYTSVFLHLSPVSEYRFSSGGKFVEMPIEYGNNVSMRDEKNYLDLLSIPKLALFLEEMKTIGGYRLLFAL